jgi:gluconolactonase
MIGALLVTAALGFGQPDTTVDLGTEAGVQTVAAEWRYSNVDIVETGFNAPDANGKPNGGPIRTYDIAPHAGSASFDDSMWEVIPAGSLAARRANGRVSFNWYRLNVRIPERIGAFDPTGSTVVFEVTVDDYAEVWVDGRLPRELGQQGGSLVAGWNAPNRLVIARNAKPGQRIQIAIFGINGPISDPPANYIWVRGAKLEFFKDGPRETRGFVPTTLDRRASGLDAIVEPGTRIEQLAEGFQFTEGPVWLPEGALLFSDPNANRIYRWSAAQGLSVFLDQSGYGGADAARYKQPGSNGLALDAQGRLTIDQHGNRRVVRVESDGRLTVLADRVDGRRLNSPNDLVYKSDGSLYVTDPPFGLPDVYDDPAKELAYSGILRVANGQVQVVARDLEGPNGIAFSPDEKFLYVANWDERAKVVNRYDVRADGTLGPGTRFFDMTGAPGAEALDGLKVDVQGNVYVSGPGGVWILSPGGEHLGTLAGPELAANMAWGDADRRTLYLTARTGLYRIRLKIPGHVTSPPPGNPTGSEHAGRTASN